MAQLAQDTFTRGNLTGSTTITTGWGSASDSEVWSLPLGAATFSIASNEGHVTGCTAATFMRLGSTTSANAEALVRVQCSATTSTRMGIALRETATNTFYIARLSANNSTIGISISKTITGTNTDLFTATFTASISTFYWIRFRCVGTSLFAKAWASGSGEPTSWTVSGTDSSITGAGGYGLTVNASSSATTWDFDSLTITDGVGYHDVSSRFRLVKANDTLTRFRLLATKSVDVLTRFRQQSGPVNHDTAARFRQQSGVLAHDVGGRLRLLATTTHDTVSRFRQQSPLQNKDAHARFRQLAVVSRDALARFRQQSGVLAHDALTRFRVQSGLVNHDALSRFRQQSGVISHDTASRFRLTVPGMRSLDAAMRFRLLASTTRSALARFRLQLSPSTRYSLSVLADSPVAYYRLGESAGTTASDSSGNSYDGTIAGSGVTLGVSGGLDQDSNTAMTLDGSSGYIALPSGVSTTGYTAFSVEFWMKLANTTFSQNARVLANDHTDSNNNGFQFALNAGGAGGFFGLGFGSYQGGANFTGSFSAATWYHLVGTWDGTTIRLYVNGVANGTSTIGGTIAAAGYPINIGRNPAYTGDYFPGTVDEVAIYHSVLSPARISSHYLAGAAVDVMTRFRLLASTSRNGLARFRLQSGVINHDTASRFRQQSGVLPHDALARFRLTTPGLKSLDALARFRLLAQTTVSVAARFRVQSAVQNKDVSGRFRAQSGVLPRDVSSRFRVQSGVTSHDTAARFRVSSPPVFLLATARFRVLAGPFSLDAHARFRQAAAVSQSATGRFRQRSALGYQDAHARFRLSISSVASRDAHGRFGLIAGTHSMITVSAPRGTITLVAPRGTMTLEAV